MGSASGNCDSHAGPRLPRRTLTYGGLLLGLVFVGAQIAPPTMPQAAAAGLHKDAAGLLPALPAQAAVEAQPAPVNAVFEITVPYPADGDLAGLLVRSGAARDEAERAARLVQERFDGHVEAGSDVKLALGQARGRDGRSIERLTILADLGRTVIARRGDSLGLVEGQAEVDRLDIAIGKAGLYPSLLGAGLDPRLALEAASLLERRRASPRMVTIVIGERPDRFEARGTPQLLYVAAAGGRPAVRLLRWPAAPDGWIDADRPAAGATMVEPVDSPISSRFGMRVHPILRFLRPHRGVDFAAGWGTPVRAAADGQVVTAGWRGGYGRQVRLDHGQALATSYSHLSAMVVAPGSRVTRGQVIGYVGASGLATGPHLHFEMTRAGRHVDPLGARLAQAGAADRSTVAARLAQLRIGGGA